MKPDWRWTSQRCTVVQSTVVWAVRLSIGNKRISTPCGTKTRQPINTKFGRGDHVGEHIRSAKKIGGRLSGGAPTRWPFVKLLWLSSPPFFPRAGHRSEATFANDVLCIKRRGSVDTRAFWGKWLPKFIFWGSSAPKTAKIFPQTGKSHLKIKCLITFNGKR